MNRKFCGCVDLVFEVSFRNKEKLVYFHKVYVISIKKEKSMNHFCFLFFFFISWKKNFNIRTEMKMILIREKLKSKMMRKNKMKNVDKNGKISYSFAHLLPTNFSNKISGRKMNKMKKKIAIIRKLNEVMKHFLYSSIFHFSFSFFFKLGIWFAFFGSV